VAEELKLVRKPDDQQPRIPADAMESYIRLGRARGELGPVAGRTRKKQRIVIDNHCLRRLPLTDETWH